MQKDLKILNNHYLKKVNSGKEKDEKEVREEFPILKMTQKFELDPERPADE